MIQEISESENKEVTGSSWALFAFSYYCYACNFYNLDMDHLITGL